VLSLRGKEKKREKKRVGKKFCHHSNFHSDLCHQKLLQKTLTKCTGVTGLEKLTSVCMQMFWYCAYLQAMVEVSLNEFS